MAFSPVNECRPELHIDIDVAKRKWFPTQPRMHKVSPQLRMKERRHSGPSVYDPILVSLGPYHHGKDEYRRAEEFKCLCLHWYADGNDQVKGRFYNKIVSKMDEIRGCYADVSIVNKYDDTALALMMLLDACFIINFMKIRDGDEIAIGSYKCLGVAGAVPFTARDIMVLENQIPFFILKMLIDEKYDIPSGKSLVAKFLNGMMCLPLDQAVIPREDENPPFHILEACRRVLVENDSTLVHNLHFSYIERLLIMPKRDDHQNIEVRTPSWTSRNYTPQRFQEVPVSMPKTRSMSKNRSMSKESNCNCITTCPSITYLKAKGVYIRPSSSHILKDVNFRSHALYGELQLPVCFVSDMTLTFLTNIIAYEIAPDNVTSSPDLAVLSYANFMKSLIQTSGDVRELQERGILRLNRFGNEKQVVELFRSIDTLNLRNINIYQDVMLRVGEHCNNKAKTWMADLIHGKLHSPWTIIALISAILLLGLTFLQTLYTINPSN